MKVKEELLRPENARPDCREVLSVPKVEAAKEADDEALTFVGRGARSRASFRPEAAPRNGKRSKWRSR